MKQLTVKQLKELSPEKLQELLREQRDILRQLRFQAGLGDLKQVHQVKQVKQTIARILTLL